MKAFKNLIIIVLIGLLSSTYILNLSPIDYRGSIEIQTPVESSTLSLKKDVEDSLVNPKSIIISHISEKDEVIKNLSKNIFTASVYKDGNLILENINSLELVGISSDSTITIDKEHPLTTTLDISQEKLKLDDGTYKIIFQSNLISSTDKSTVSVDVTYDTAGTYIPAMTASPSGTKGLTLYFTTHNNDTLIPVTRFSVENKSLTRMAIEQLQNGPQDPSLATVVGDVTNCTYNNGNVVIDIPGRYQLYNEEGSEAPLAYNAFLKTIFAVRRYWPIHSVSFTVDRKSVETYFGGIDKLKSVSDRNDAYNLYLAYNVNGRYYLFNTPVNREGVLINENDSIEVKGKKLFDAYSNSGLKYGRNPIPADIVLQGIKLEGSNIILDFNNSFLKAYENKEDLKIMMVESLIYSYTSIPNITGLKITVDEKPLTNFVKGRDLSGILTPPEFINPEVVQ